MLRLHNNTSQACLLKNNSHVNCKTWVHQPVAVADKEWLQRYSWVQRQKIDYKTYVRRNENKNGIEDNIWWCLRFICCYAIIVDQGYFYLDLSVSGRTNKLLNPFVKCIKLLYFPYTIPTPTQSESCRPWWNPVTDILHCCPGSLSLFCAVLGLYSISAKKTPSVLSVIEAISSLSDKHSSCRLVHVWWWIIRNPSHFKDCVIAWKMSWIQLQTNGAQILLR